MTYASTSHDGRIIEHSAVSLWLVLLLAFTSFCALTVQAEPLVPKGNAKTARVQGPARLPDATAQPLRTASLSNSPSAHSMGAYPLAVSHGLGSHHRSSGCGIGPQSPCPVHGFHCVGPCCDACDNVGWKGAGPIPWEAFAQGEYVGPARLQHVPEYRLRVDDRVNFIFRLTREASAEAYRLEVGDRIQIQSLTADELNQEVIIQPDGSISLRLLGQVLASGRTIDELREHLDEQYKGHVREPSISVIPLVIDSRLEAVRDAVDNRFGSGGQSRATRVTPEGTIQLPAIGSVNVQGLSLDELRREINLRYSAVVKGLDVTPILDERAPRYVFVLGEVRRPGRFTLEGPTTVIQAIALAQSWNVGAHLHSVVVFRRDENWNLMATKLDIHDAVFGKRPCPADEIWLRDLDIVLVPKSPLLHADDMINLIFARGIYSVFPARFSYSKVSR